MELYERFIGSLVFSAIIVYITASINGDADHPFKPGYISLLSSPHHYSNGLIQIYP
jgi:hypothetical protein